MRTLAATVVFLVPVLARADVAVTIDNARPHQTMQGFGATTLSLAYGATDNVPAASRPRAIDALYNQVKLNMGNLEVEPFESPTTNVYAPANDDGDPRTFAAAGWNWTQSDNMFQKVVRPGQAYGYDHFYIGPVLSSGYALAWAPALRTSNYQRYLDELAEHVAAVAIHWRDAYGITPAYMQLFNEPLSGNGELAGGNIQEIVDLIKRCGDRLRAEGFATMKFVVPAEETEDKSLADAQTILADPDAAKYVGAIAYHPYPYGSTYAAVPNILATSGSGTPDPGRVAVRNQLRDLARQHGIPTMMVEVSHAEVAFTSFDHVRGRAIQIHDELEYADAAAFFGMNAMWDSTSHAQHYAGRQDPGFYTESDTVVLIDNTIDQVVISPMGRAIGHYARWITRGAVRLDATSADPLVQVTAFRDDRQGKLVVVAINNASAPRTLAVAVSGLPMLGATLAGERSTAAAPWVAFAQPAAATGWSIDLPAQSVTSMSVDDGIIPVTGDGAANGNGDAGVGGGGARGGCGCSSDRARGGDPAQVALIGLAVAAALRRRRARARG